jgi:hypothetical protein
MRFRVQIRGQLVGVDMSPGATMLTLLEGPGLLVERSSEELRLTRGAPVRRATTRDLPRAA